MRIKVLFSVLVLFSLLASCNMPAGQVTVAQPSEIVPVSSDVDAVGTAVELTAAAKLTEIAGSATATFTANPELTPTFTLTPTVTTLPAQCTPLVTANVVANVRSGPDTAYDIVGSLSLGQTATIAGRNDANNWWNIEYPVGSGRFAWIAGSVVTPSCLPAVVQVVAAPPLPTAPPAAADDNSDDSNDNNNSGGSSGKPDLVAYAMQYYVVSGKTVHVMVSVKNSGNAVAGGFTVKWMANQDKGGCDWQVQGLGPGKRKDLECEYTYEWGANQYTSTLFVDWGGGLAEQDENNNKQYYDVKLK
ncbi:MAG TPA: CARDB domain-containing protein [Anaerolineales bacterium]|nr:CARDB domain-containing protein [Anaerolineales bacterium]